MRRAKVLIWSGGLVAVVGFAVLAMYMASVGWDKADKVASVVNLFVALAGVLVAVWGAVAAGGGGGLRVGGSYTDVRKVKGSVVIRRRSRPGALPAPGPGTAVGGNYDRVSGVDGPLHIKDEP
ncbi:hypothetical protein [Spirillospora sp. NPDC048823]|uniref:hypothetical protein n=1 Tax=unclassified Spirillospora TaxID=2642701 RepID=UPI00371480D7